MRTSPSNHTEDNGNDSYEETELEMKTVFKMENGNNLGQISSISTSVNAPDRFPLNTSFSTRHTASCCFSYVDDRAIQLMGYSPTDMIGHSVFDFYHPKDVHLLKDVFELVVKKPGSILRNSPSQFKIRNGGYITLESEWCCFINPWSHSLEFVIGQHRILTGCSDVDIFFPANKETYFLKTNIKESQNDQMEIENLLSETRAKCPINKNERIMKDINVAIENQNLSDSTENEMQSEQSSSLTRRSSFESANSKEEGMDCEKDNVSMNSSIKVELPLKNACSYKIAVPNVEDTLKKDMEFLEITPQPELGIKQFQILKNEQENEKICKLNIRNHDVREYDIQDITLYLPTENKVKHDSNSVMHDISPLHEVNGSSSSSDTPPTMQQMWLEENIDRFFASDPKTCCDESDESNKNDKFYQRSQNANSRSKDVSGSTSTFERQQTSPSNFKNNFQASNFSYDSGYDKSAENDGNPSTSYEGSVTQTWLTSSPNNNDEKFPPFQPLTEQSLSAQNRMNHDQFKQRKNKLLLDKHTLKNNCYQPKVSSKHIKNLHKRSLMKSRTTQTSNEIPVVCKATLEYSGHTQLTFNKFMDHANLSQAKGFQNFCVPSPTSADKHTESPIYQTRRKCSNAINERVEEDSTGTNENQSHQNASDSMESDDQAEKSPSLSRRSSFKSTDKNDEDMDSEKDSPSAKTNSNKLKLPFEIAFRYQMTVPSMKDILEKDKEFLKTVVQPELVLQQLLVLQKEWETGKNCKLNVGNKDCNITHDIKLHLPSENRVNNDSNSVMQDISPLNDVNCSSSSSDTPPTMQQMWLEENIDRFFASDPKTCCDESNESNSDEKFNQHSQDSHSISTDISESTSVSECQTKSSTNFENKIPQTNLFSYNSSFDKVAENDNNPSTSHERCNKQTRLNNNNAEKFSSCHHLTEQSLSTKDSLNHHQFKQQMKNSFSFGKRSLEDDCERQSSTKRKKRMYKIPLMKSRTTQTNNEILVKYKGTVEYSGYTQLNFPKLIYNENLSQAFGFQNFSPPSSSSTEENPEYPTCQVHFFYFRI